MVLSYEMKKNYILKKESLNKVSDDPSKLVKDNKNQQCNEHKLEGLQGPVSNLLKKRLFILFCDFTDAKNISSEDLLTFSDNLLFFLLGQIVTSGQLKSGFEAHA